MIARMSQPPELHRTIANPEPDILGSAARVRPGAMQWYLPTWSERLRFMGWRILYFLPIVIVVGLTVCAFLLRNMGMTLFQFWFVWWKLAILAVGLSLTAGVKAARDALRARPDPFCIHCGYSVVGLPDHHNCPECGEQFDLSVIAEYKQDPHAFIERYKQTGKLPTKEHVPFEAGQVSSPKSADGT